VFLIQLNYLPCVYPTVYDVSGTASDRNVVVMSDIHIDIMDYIMPATCTDAEFRSMWAEFEWENKVRIGLSPCIGTW
jgi:coatomer subunit beta